MRDKFEEWAKDYVKGRGSNDRYTSPYTQAAWEAWQAASSAGLKPFPEGKPPNDGRYLFWSPGNPHANNPSARWSYFKVDEFCPDWPSGKYQFPESPYTHFSVLPAAPSH